VTPEIRQRVQLLLKELAGQYPTKEPVRLGRTLPASDDREATLDWSGGCYTIRFASDRPWVQVADSLVHEWAHARVGDRFRGTCYRHALHDEHWGLEYARAYCVVYETT
jgi:hypothetical protein